VPISFVKWRFFNGNRFMFASIYSGSWH